MSGVVYRNVQIPSLGLDSAELVVVGDRIHGIQAVGYNRCLPENTDDSAIRTVDAKGLAVLPGLIDLHVHFRDPGFPEKETTETGCLAAARGGVTTVCTMPNTKPVVDSVETLELIDRAVKAANGVHVLPLGTITRGESGETLTDYGALNAVQNESMRLLGRGLAAVSEDGKSVMNPRLMRDAMNAIHTTGLKVFSHAEEIGLCGGSMRLGASSKRLGVVGIPAEAESIIVARDILLSEATGCPVHFCHISTASSVSLIHWAKARGLPVTAETGPHYLTLTDEDVQAENGHFKMNPPLGNRKDKEALIEGLIDGTIDAIATDHAPHTAEEKNRPIMNAPFGVTGLETSFCASYTALVKSGLMTLQRLIERMSTRPAEILGLNRGKIEPGAAADLTFVDLNETFVLDPAKSLSKAKHSPFAGREFSGAVKFTVINGKMIYEDWKGFNRDRQLN